MELQDASEYFHEFLRLQKKAQCMELKPQLVFTVDAVNIPGLSRVLYKYYRNTQSRHLTPVHKNLLLLRRCYCVPTLPRCFCMENQVLMEWCWLKFASVAELHTIAHLLAAHVENNFWFPT